METRKVTLLILKSKKPVNYTGITVPVCLAEQEMEYSDIEGILPTFMVNNKTLTLNILQLRKGQRQMSPLSGEQCEDKLTGGGVAFDQSTQICSMHEPLANKNNSINPMNDSQPVILYKELISLILPMDPLVLTICIFCFKSQLGP